ncbi:probable serine/threonine-protein kinase tsuA [Anthonomus grandis grandis]|uniref:probable serine/threonine-protein kinase tsuA n=1 Tax=Anthonomus grandis grandis TaxID=2921223 RepID=UPI002166880F|nr:probable serine/threonine-protein kinase tsuA [Anthonomus grandis grandis]
MKLLLYFLTAEIVCGASISLKRQTPIQPNKNAKLSVYSLSSFDQQNPLFIRTIIPNELKPTERELKRLEASVSAQQDKTNYNNEENVNFLESYQAVPHLSLPVRAKSIPFASLGISTTSDLSSPLINAVAVGSFGPKKNNGLPNIPSEKGATFFQTQGPNGYTNENRLSLPTKHFESSGYTIEKVPEVTSYTKQGPFSPADIPSIIELENIFKASQLGRIISKVNGNKKLLEQENLKSTEKKNLHYPKILSRLYNIYNISSVNNVDSINQGNIVNALQISTDNTNNRVKNNDTLANEYFETNSSAVNVDSKNQVNIINALQIATDTDTSNGDLAINNNSNTQINEDFRASTPLVEINTESENNDEESLKYSTEIPLEITNISTEYPEIKTETETERAVDNVEEHLESLTENYNIVLRNQEEDNVTIKFNNSLNTGENTLEFNIEDSTSKYHITLEESYEGLTTEEYGNEEIGTKEYDNN